MEASSRLSRALFLISGTEFNSHCSPLAPSRLDFIQFHQHTMSYKRSKASSALITHRPQCALSGTRSHGNVKIGESKGVEGEK